MKVLILVMSSSIMDYPLLEKVQMETWDSIDCPGISTIYYLAGQRTELINNKLYIQGGEGWEFYFNRTMLALKEILPLDWDYVFKTDNSAYVNKAELIKTLESKPRTRYFGGRIFHQNLPLGPYNFLWGEGYVLSRDIVKYLVSLFPAYKAVQAIDDQQISKMLYGRYPFAKLPMYEYYEHPRPIPLVHVYRCKKGTKPRHGDEIFAMKDIHEVLTKK